MHDKDTPFAPTTKALHCKDQILEFSSPKVMGVLNITPDSFYDGGRYMQEKRWMEQGEKMISDGASIIDLGAMSTRPGAAALSWEEEMERMALPLELLKKAFPDTLFSIDTYHANTAEECINLGADIINDISGGTMDDAMFGVIARYKVPYVLMHIHGTPANMQEQPLHENCVALIRKFFTDKVQELRSMGINNLIIDPGFGFGKTLRCNYDILKHLASFRIDGLPILGGISRKSMINKILNTNPSKALNGTTVLNTIALLNGADILRVHDVKEAMEAIKVVSYYKEFGGSNTLSC